LHVLARSIGAKRALEIGTLGGYSAIWIGRALGEGGRLITLEIDPLHAKIARENIAFAGLSASVDVRIGRASDSLAAMERDRVEPFDFVFIDADKRNNPVYVDWALRHSHPGTLIVVDNVVRGGDVLNERSSDLDIRGTREVLQRLSSDPRLCSTAIQTVGHKGYDGFAIALVTS
jgi:predicted O-methyltransferase YrrM